MPAKNVEVKVRNLSPRTIVFRCTSGKTLHLAPRGGSGPIPKAEVQNAKAEKLQAKRLIEVNELSPRKKPAEHKAKVGRTKKETGKRATKRRKTGGSAAPKTTQKKATS